MSKYLVTGAAGFIGSHLAEHLLEAGNEVTGIDAFRDYYSEEIKRANISDALRHDRFALVQDDLANCDIGDLLEGCAGVFHLAAQAGVRGSWGDSFEVYLRDNIGVTQRLFEAALNKGCRVVFASSSSVYGDALSYPTHEDARCAPVSPYGVSKLACEHLSHAYERRGLDVVALRYFTVYGPRQRPDMAFQRIAEALIRDMPFTVLGDGTQSRDVTYVGDAVSATVAAMSAGVRGHAYNVGGGSETTLLDAIHVFEDLAGATVPLHYEDVATGDVRRTVSSTERVRDDLDWAPKTDLREGARRQLEWAQGRPVR